MLALRTVLLAVGFVLQTSLAQTPPGYSPSTLINLGVNYPDDIIIPGVLYPAAGTHTSLFDELPSYALLTTSPVLADVQTQPTLYAPITASSSHKYITFMIDIDVNEAGTATTLLHWYQPNLVVGSDRSLSASNTVDPSAPYAGPAPLVGPAHRYVILLFKQPIDYVLPDCYASITPLTLAARMGFDIEEFMQVAGLGSPVGANWFKVKNDTPATTTVAITSTYVSSAACAATA
jgi:hypothetical protein